MALRSRVGRTKVGRTKGSVTSGRTGYSPSSKSTHHRSHSGGGGADIELECLPCRWCGEIGEEWTYGNVACLNKDCEMYLHMIPEKAWNIPFLQPEQPIIKKIHVPDISLPSVWSCEHGVKCKWKPLGNFPHFGTMRYAQPEWLEWHKKECGGRLVELYRGNDQPEQPETETVLGLDNPYPLKDVLRMLVRATDILLNKKNYDGADYEEMGVCAERAIEIIGQLDQAKPQQPDKWVRPTDNQLIEIAILFNNGKIQQSKLADMVGMCQFILDRLFENGDVTKRSSKEPPKPEQP
jgi:hypothetical protein